MPLAVYEWLIDGESFGCGTEFEFEYWNAEGVNPIRAKMGKIICYEPAAADNDRRKFWAQA